MKSSTSFCVERKQKPCQYWIRIFLYLPCLYCNQNSKPWTSLHCGSDTAPDKGIEGRLAVIYVLPGNRNFRSAVLPRLHWTVWKQLDQQLWATQAESKKINTASNNKRISSFQYFPSPYLLNSLVLVCLFLYCEDH